jgi:LysM repeat protein
MSNTSKMLVRSLLLALSISSNFVLQAQSAALYVYYDPACMDKYTYAKEGNPGFEGYHDYHLTINDSTRYVFTVFNSKTNNVANFSSMPADFTSCANRRLSLPEIDAVNKGTRQAYMVTEEPTGYQSKVIAEISVWVNNENTMKLLDADFSLSFKLDDLYSDGTIITNATSPKPAFFTGETTVSCKRAFVYREMPFGFDNSSFDFTFIPDIGMYSKVNGEGSLQLIFVNGVAISDFIQKLCDKNASVFAANNKPVKPTVPTDKVIQPVNPNPPYIVPEAHFVAPGETLYSISDAYPNLTIAKLKEWNGLTDENSIKPGDKIWLKPGMITTPATPAIDSPVVVTPEVKPVVPEVKPVVPEVKPVVPEVKQPEVPALDPTGPYHVVKQGENLYKISKTYNIPVEELRTINGLKTDALDLGQKIYLRKGSNPVEGNNDISQLTTTPETTPLPGKGFHVVKPNESIFAIAEQHNVTLNQLIVWNSLTSLDVAPGTQLKVSEDAAQPAEVTEAPLKPGYHRVKAGETLALIANKYDLSQMQLVEWNKLTDLYLNVGQELRLIPPVETKPETPAPSTPAQPSSLTKTIWHTVKPGEDLMSIAERYNVTDTDIINWNTLTALPTDGQQLRLEVPANQAVPTPQPQPVQPKPEPSKPATSAATHTVQKGETLFGICRKYNVTVDQVTAWNKLTSNELKLGQVLKVAAPGSGTTVTPSPEKPATPPASTAKAQYHTVAKGEGLWGIAKKYNTTVDAIRALNGMADNEIKLGQKLRVK